MRIAVTGTPGTGKTTVAENLAEEVGMEYLDLTEEVQKGASVGYDEKRDTYVADMVALEEKVPDDVVLDGHIAHRLENDYTVVLRCGPEELHKRLSERGWEEAKITENVQSEVLDVLLAEALEAGAGTHTDTDTPVFEYDTTDSKPKETVERLIEAIEKEEKRSGTVNWTGSIDGTYERR